MLTIIEIEKGQLEIKYNLASNILTELYNDGIYILSKLLIMYPHKSLNY